MGGNFSSYRDEVNMGRNHSGNFDNAKSIWRLRDPDGDNAAWLQKRNITQILMKKAVIIERFTCHLYIYLSRLRSRLLISELHTSAAFFCPKSILSSTIHHTRVERQMADLYFGVATKAVSCVRSPTPITQKFIHLCQRFSV